MAWCRFAHADLPSKAISEMYPYQEKRPVRIALEGNEENGRPSLGVNAVLYLDIAMETERNDFFFENIDEALNYFSSEFELDRSLWFLYDEPQVL